MDTFSFGNADSLCVHPGISWQRKPQSLALKFNFLGLHSFNISRFYHPVWRLLDLRENSETDQTSQLGWVGVTSRLMSRSSSSPV